MESNEQTALFTCTYGPGEDEFKQLYLAARKGWRIFWFIFYGAFLIFIGYHLTDWILWCLYAREPIWSGPTFWLFIGQLALLVFLFVWEMTAPKRYAKKQLRRIAETYGGADPTVRVSFLEEGMQLHNEASNSTTQMSYATIAKCIETTSLFLLITKEKQFLTLKKDGFEGIDIPGIRAFFDAKCPSAKRKWQPSNE